MVNTKWTILLSMVRITVLLVVFYLILMTRYAHVYHCVCVCVVCVAIEFCDHLCFDLDHSAP